MTRNRKLRELLGQTTLTILALQGWTFKRLRTAGGWRPCYYQGPGTCQKYANTRVGPWQTICDECLVGWAKKLTGQ